jgi:hypothetical protein
MVSTLPPYPADERPIYMDARSTRVLDLTNPSSTLRSSPGLHPQPSLLETARAARRAGGRCHGRGVGGGPADEGDAVLWTVEEVCAWLAGLSYAQQTIQRLRGKVDINPFSLCHSVLMC